MRVQIIFSKQEGTIIAIQFFRSQIGLEGALPKGISVGDTEKEVAFSLFKPFNNFQVKFLRPVPVTKCMKSGVVLSTVNAECATFKTEEMQFSFCNNYSVQNLVVKFSQFDIP